MTAKDMYRQLQSLVDEACRVDSFHVAIKGAQALGMVGGRDEKNIYALVYEFTANDESGASVTLRFHSYDQSKAFDVQPDMNKFKIALTHPDGITEVHTNEYEG